jgi:predicted DNA-binding protein (MmcQ/YjbR family)
MDFLALKNYCLSKKGAYEDYPFGPEPLVIKVSSKMFALLSIRMDKVTLSLKCDPFVAQNLRQQYAAVQPGYHMNKEHWNTVSLDDSVPETELLWMIDHSYEMVVKGLSKDEKLKLQDA